jgi:DNA-binding LacI/PurR family transcriptional regulator
VLTLGREKGIEMIPVINTSSVNQKRLRPPEVTQAMKDQAVDGIIGMLLFESMTEWMDRDGIPYAVLSANNRNDVVPDYFGMIDIAFSRLAELGCKSVGLMLPSSLTNASLLEHMQLESEKLGIKVNYEWIIVSRQSQEISGYNHFLSLWDLPVRPDGLVIFPDITARGVVSAVVEKRVQVPKELKLVLHRNAENPYVVPVPCDWLENSVEPLAEALFRKLEAQWSGQAPTNDQIAFRLVKGQ